MRLPASDPASSLYDVVIIGAGLAGTLAAILLGRSGLNTALIDPHTIYPPDFRAEQLVGAQVQTLRRLGLLDILVQDQVPASHAVAMQAGRLIGIETAPHYGVAYEDMVNRARQHLPPFVRFIKAKVRDLHLSADRQQLRLCDGGLIQGRLVVLATGLGRRLLHEMQMRPKVIRAEQSLTFGFDVEVARPAMFASSVLVVYGERRADCIDYLTLFPVENRLRANLFTYHDRHDPWVRWFVQQPGEMLREVMPALSRTVGEVTVVGAVQMRVNELMRTTGQCQHGLVLIGDAFQTSCPAAGTGIGRLLNDVERLCHVHIPRWLATEGMGVEKIRQFYADPVKQASDAEALRVAGYRRAFVTEAGLHWAVHRQRVALQRRLQLALSLWASGSRALERQAGLVVSEPTPKADPIGALPAA